MAICAPYELGKPKKKGYTHHATQTKTKMMVYHVIPDTLAEIYLNNNRQKISVFVSWKNWHWKGIKKKKKKKLNYSLWISIRGNFHYLNYFSAKIISLTTQRSFSIQAIIKSKIYITIKSTFAIRNLQKNKTKLFFEGYMKVKIFIIQSHHQQNNHQ